jgi:hypothetical protein
MLLIQGEAPYVVFQCLLLLVIYRFVAEGPLLTAILSYFANSAKTNTSYRRKTAPRQQGMSPGNQICLRRSLDPKLKQLAVACAEP